MSKKENKPLNKTWIIALSIIAAAILVSITYYVFTNLSKPERSVANFCQVAKDNKNAFQGSSSYQDRLDAFTKLNLVAPTNIEAETNRIQIGYNSMVEDSSKTINTEMGISSSLLKVSDYIKTNCPNY